MTRQTDKQLLDDIATMRLDLAAVDRFMTKEQMANRERFKADEAKALAELEKLAKKK
jgi:hypothetical protein